MVYRITNKTKNLTIGKPYNNFSLYILDNNLRPLPIGAIGELYIGGDGLARGYLNRDDLTKERFIANPFVTKEDKALGKNTRVYKTGDLVRYREDGNIEYIGRNDDQVKIRGFRIELAEIENVLGGIEGVKQAVVIDRVNKDNNSKYLVAYYVAVNKIDEELIRNELGSKLPEYMVPSAIVYLTSMPLTINGKLDKRALPEVSFSDSSKYVAPRNELEGKICEIYAEVLGLKAGSVGINDNFFNLGGDSILAIKLVNVLYRK
jgi:acyl-coenzyme A synthetase/AMP-(fatty) acid ligase